MTFNETRARTRPSSRGPRGAGRVHATQLALSLSQSHLCCQSRHSRLGDYPFGATTSEELPGNLLAPQGPSSAAAAQNFESVKVGCDGWQRHVRPSHHRKRCSSLSAQRRITNYVLCNLVVFGGRSVHRVRNLATLWIYNLATLWIPIYIGEY